MTSGLAICQGDPVRGSAPLEGSFWLVNAPAVGLTGVAGIICDIPRLAIPTKVGTHFDREYRLSPV